MQPRENTRLAKTIEQAIVIDSTYGAAKAWAYLSSHQVPTPTILRVLSSHEQRRASDRQLTS
jgi:hypothetical protein